MNELFRQSLFAGAAISLIAYEIGLFLKKRLGWAVLNPLLVSIILVIIALKGFGISYEVYNASAKYISYLLTPATVCLAVPLYEQLELLKKNMVAVVCGILSGTLASLCGIFALCTLFGFNHQQYVTMLPKSITTAIGIGISEELGGIFAICLIMVCISCFLMFLNIAMQMKEQFYKLVALGLGTVYAFQVFLTIGGVTKFIPSTGVTLPLVSYGGSSLLATMMLFAVIQGLYILRQDEGENNARKKQRKTGYERQQVEELY